MSDAHRAGSDSRAAITITGRASDGLPSTAIHNAKVKCSECTGWNGTECPHGCGVSLISTQAEDDAALMAELRAEAAERKAYLARRKAERA